MWIIFGRKVETERVPGGERVERHCDHCGETAVFYERRMIAKLQLYFLDVLEYDKRRVMACGACGTLYGTDELGVVADPVDKMFGRAKEALDRFSGAARSGLERVRGETERLLDRENRPEDAERGAQRPTTNDPLAEDDAAMEAKFRELEKKYGASDD